MNTIRPLLWLLPILVVNAWLGGKLGVIMSYWFAPSIMRIYLSWSDYLERLPDALHSNMPIGLYPIVTNCYLVGISGSLLITIYLYYRIKLRK